MHKILEDIVSEVTRYSTVWGQIWYLIVFGYRFIVVSLLGEYVYEDEQEMFQCSVDLAGCTEMCYNEYAKISHLRFWGFQLLAVTAPTFVFHFYSLYVQRQVLKIEEHQQRIADMNAMENESIREADKQNRRRKKIGKYKKIKVYQGGDFVEIPTTKRVHAAYLLNVVLRLLLEGLFLYFTYILFETNNDKIPSASPNFLWMYIPGRYECKITKDNMELWTACGQHMNSYVPCWVSRPFEKMVFLRYMNVTAFICLVLSAIEVVAVLKKRFCRRKKKKPQEATRTVVELKSVDDPPGYSDRNPHYKVINLSVVENMLMTTGGKVKLPRYYINHRRSYRLRSIKLRYRHRFKSTSMGQKVTGSQRRQRVMSSSSSRPNKHRRVQ